MQCKEIIFAGIKIHRDVVIAQSGVQQRRRPIQAVANRAKVGAVDVKRVVA